MRAKWGSKTGVVTSVQVPVQCNSSLRAYMTCLTIFRTIPVCGLRCRVYTMPKLHRKPTHAQLIPQDSGTLNQYFIFDSSNPLTGMDRFLLPETQLAKCRTQSTTWPRAWRHVYEPAAEYSSVHRHSYQRNTPCGRLVLCLRSCRAAWRSFAATPTTWSVSCYYNRSTNCVNLRPPRVCAYPQRPIKIIALRLLHINRNSHGYNSCLWHKGTRCCDSLQPSV